MSKSGPIPESVKAHLRAQRLRHCPCSDMTHAARKENAPLLRLPNGRFGAFLGVPGVNADMLDNIENQLDPLADGSGASRQGLR